ncbi:MAG TPA: hypothetical protein VLU46_07910 [Thermoanaerobaculia bacterium]|nr:hypothetical protein [Thermoanaerobaculia bacterium]
MNQKRKADLQRKLSMTAVPRPPAGLAERIKADIPHDLHITAPETSRRFFGKAFSLRVAASVILLVAASYVVMHLLTRYELESVMPNVTRSKRVEAAPQSTAEVTIDLSEEPKRAARTAAAKTAPARPQQPAPVVAQKTEQRYAPEVAAPQVAGGAAAPAPAGPPMAAAESNARRTTVAASAPAIIDSARAADMVFAAPREVFGLSVDPKAFDRVKQKIDQGERPVPGTIDVAGLVNYFAGYAKPPRREVRLDVEGSRSPSEPHAAVIHFSVETPRAPVPRGSSLPPVGTDADLTITLNSDAVVSHRLMGAESLKSESTLVKNTAVTGVVEVQLSPAVRPTETVATLRLRYRSAVDGKPHTVTKYVRASELMRSWDSATRRHRLATLSALWSESVNGGEATHDVARKAEKLATEAPDDVRARELAAAATAFSRLQNSGPTGSAR